MESLNHSDNGKLVTGEGSKENDKFHEVYDEAMKIFKDKLWILIQKARKEKDTKFMKCLKNYMAYFSKMVRDDADILAQKLYFLGDLLEKGTQRSRGLVSSQCGSIGSSKFLINEYKQKTKVERTRRQG